MKSPPHSRLVVGVAAIALLLTGMLIRGLVTPSRAGDAAADTATTAPAHAARPTSEASRDGEAAADRSRDGAVAAALRLAEGPQSWLYLADEDVVASVRQIAAAGSADRLADEILGEVRAVREALATSPGRVWWLVRPLAWRVDAFSNTRARVSVWTVSVLSAADVAMPQSEWVTTTLDLRWEAGSWRLAATSETPGPSPQLAGRDDPWEPEPFDDALDGFQRVGAEAPR